MAIYVSNDVDINFVKTTVKEYYLMYLNSCLNNRNKKAQIESMNDYLKDNYEVDIKTIFKEIINNILITTQDKDYKLTVNGNVFVNNYNLDMLMRLVDYGNAEIRGLHIFNKAEKYIQDKLQALFTLHTLKGLN